ncbi:MAG: CehA/McbA family metallohydrolase [Polyangiaceae bacterium]
MVRTRSVRFAALLVSWAGSTVAACSSSTSDAPIGFPDAGDGGACGAAGLDERTRIPGGDPDGHRDPFGAKAAGQARAGRIHDPAQIRQPLDARAKVRLGDFVLANDSIAVYVEGAGESDGYDPFGGEILGLETVDASGLPLGTSQYGETLVALSRQAVKPESVTVLHDGSDGGEAVVRVSGVLTNIPFLETFKALLGAEYGFPAALDYVLAPGSPKLTLRLTLVNFGGERVDFATTQMIGFFQSSRQSIFTPEHGYATPSGDVAWVGFDGGPTAFVWRTPKSAMSFGIEISGFQYFQAKGLGIDGCTRATVDYAEVFVGGPGIDGALAAMRKSDGDTTFREVKGTVVETGGGPLVGARVHVVGNDSRLVTRAVTDAAGAFTLHAPDRAVDLVVTATGFDLPSSTPLPAGASTVVLEVPTHGTIAVHARDAATSAKLPVRVQVVPVVAPSKVPPSFGIDGETNGRLHQDFAMGGESRLRVPAGEHRVIVSRGFEWELVDRTIRVDAGATVDVDAVLERSVNSDGVMCADFHVHSNYSMDSDDPVPTKIRAAVADGLEIPVSSEHEWVHDFQPELVAMGLAPWAYGFSAEELTTFTWGHFGVVPLTVRPESVNNGAVAWVGKKPPEIFGDVHALPERPLVVVNHPSSPGFMGYFSSIGFERSRAAGAPDLWSDAFDAVEVFNASDLDSNRDKSVGDWFALLDAGKTVWAVGNSDSHHVRTDPVGYPRNCLAFGHDDPSKLSPTIVRDTLAKGRNVVSGGFLMTVAAPGGLGPGDTLAPGSTSPVFHVTVVAPRWLDATTLETFVDGKTVDVRALVPGSTGHRYEADVTVTPVESRARHWVVFHAKGDPTRDLSPLAPGKKPFAVSNPIFF